MNSFVDMESVFILPWQSSFSTGIEVVDEQHRQLVVLIDKLANIVVHNEEEVSLTLVYDELVEYAHFHFETEEALWQSYFGQSDEFIQHQKVHNNFVESLKEFDFDDPFQILGFLINWLTKHILYEDLFLAKVGKHVQSGESMKGAKLLARQELVNNTEFIDGIISLYSQISETALKLARQHRDATLLLDELQESKNREKYLTRVFVDSVPGYVALCTESGSVVRCNIALKNKMKHSEKRCSVGKIYNILVQEDVATFKDLVAKAENFSFKTTFILKNETNLPVSVNVSFVDINGQKHFVLVAVDISDLVSTSNLLREQEQLYKEAQKLAHLGHWKFEHATQTIVWSEQIYDIFGKGKSDFSPNYKDFMELVHPDDRQLLGEAFQESVANHQDYDIKHRIVLESGEVKYVHEQGKTTYNQAGEPLVTFGSVIDITNDMEKQLRIERQSAETEEALKATVVAVGKALEARDPYTAGHQQRVAHISVAIADKLGFSEQRKLGLWLGAAVHDIGKIGIPVELLTKPTRISDVEYAMIKEHPALGANIFTNVDFPWPINEIINQHHERLDGSGYPNGLTSDQICLEAKIVAVADVFEAMSAHRPYRPALGTEMAVKELVENKGIFYDEASVDALLALLEEDVDYETFSYADKL